MNIVERLVSARPAQFSPQRFGYTQWRVVGPDCDRHYRREERHQRVRQLIERIVDLIADSRLIIASEPPMPDMAHHTYDFDRVRAHSLNPEALSNRVASSESMLR